MQSFKVMRISGDSSDPLHCAIANTPQHKNLFEKESMFFKIWSIKKMKSYCRKSASSELLYPKKGSNAHKLNPKEIIKSKPPARGGLQNIA